MISENLLNDVFDEFLFLPISCDKIHTKYTQYPIIRNGHIRHGAEITGNLKKTVSKGSNLRNALK